MEDVRLSSNGRLAYLISAYIEPNTLVNLVNTLDYCADFFIHIDLKSNIEAFCKPLEKKSNVYFVSNRKKVYWGGYSQVELQLEMISLMLKKKVKYTRVINITGTDYPVFDNTKLQNYFNDQSKEYILGINCNLEQLEPSSRNLIDRFRHFHLPDTNRYLGTFIERLKLPNIFFKKYHYDLYYGSEYWALTYDCIQYVYSHYVNDKALQGVLKHSFVPSEAWVHTVLFNSPFREKTIGKIENVYQGLQSLSPISYFEYGKSIKILNESDYELIIRSGKPFARKIILGKSDGLLELIASKLDNSK